MGEGLDKEEHNYGAKDGESASNPEGTRSSIDRAGTTEICAVFELKHRMSVDEYPPETIDFQPIHQRCD